MKINREELMSALRVVRPGLASKEMIEQSTSFAFMGERVVTYNDEISISHPVKDLNITGAIKAEELYELLGRLTGEEIGIRVTESEVIIRSGKARAGFTLQREITLPLVKTEEISSWKKLPEGLPAVMQFCLFSCSNDMSRPVLTCVHLQKDGVVESCDNYRATRYRMDVGLPFDNVLIPGKTVEKLVQYEVEEVAESAGWLHFRTGEGTVFSCRTVEGEYPDVGSVLPVDGEEVVFPKEIGGVLERASVFLKDTFLLDKAVSVHLKDRKALVRVKGESGWFEEEIAASYSGEPIAFSVNPVFLQEVCEKVQTCYLTEGRVIKFVGGNWEHVIALQEV